MKAIIAGVAVFLSVGGASLCVALIVLVQLHSRSIIRDPLEFNVYGMLAYLLALGLGAVMAGYVVARATRSAPYVHSVLLVLLFAAAHQVYLRWGPDTLWDQLFGSVKEILFICFPLCMLGTLVGRLGSIFGWDVEKTKSVDN